LTIAEEHLGIALDALDGAGLAEASVTELRDMALFVVGRDF
jgi:hypothetical protein